MILMNMKMVLSNQFSFKLFMGLSLAHIISYALINFKIHKNN